MRNELVRGVSTLFLFGALVSPALGASPYYKEVCASGCAYSSVQAAVDSITDSSATKIYTIFIDSGVLQSDSSIRTNGKSYINFVGRGAGVSVLQASPAWYSNVAGGTTTPDFFDFSGSTNVTVTNLTIDASSTDPGTVSTMLAFAAVKVGPGTGGKILFRGCGIQAINYGMWEDGTATGGLIEIFDSKVQSASIAVYLGGNRWHIYSSELRVVDNGGTSGTVGTASTVYAYVGEATLWGSHVHAESSRAGQTYPVYAVQTVTSSLATVTVIGSTVHVKMTTTDIGSSSRYMSAAYIGPGIGNFVGTEFLYENTGGALSQGRLSGLKTAALGTINLSGCTFRDAGGSGGTSRSDLIVPPTAGSLKFRAVGTQIASLSLIQGTTVPAAVVKGLSTAAAQRGPATFLGSGSVVVTLPVALPDANYNVTVSTTGTAPLETFTVTGITKTGFTINSSNPSSTATVMWFLN